MSDESKKKEPEVQEQEETHELSDDQLETASGGAQDTQIFNKYFHVEVKGMYQQVLPRRGQGYVSLLSG